MKHFATLFSITLLGLLPSSSATLSLPPNTNIIAAYLYWSGSGNGDLEVTLNATDIVAEDTYIVDFNAEIMLVGVCM